MEIDFIKNDFLVENGKLVIKCEIDGDVAYEYWAIVHNLTGLRMFDYSQKELFEKVKIMCYDLPKQEEYNDAYIKVENKIEELITNGLIVKSEVASDFMDIFMPAAAYLVQENKILDGIYRYNTHKIERDIFDLLDFIDGELKEDIEVMIKDMRIMKGTAGFDFSSKDLLNIFLRYDKKYKPKKIFTYIMSDNFGLYKIGKSMDVSKRLMELRIGNPTIKLEFVIDADVETELHRKYEIKNRGGEWFALNDKDINDIKNTYHVD